MRTVRRSRLTGPLRILALACALGAAGPETASVDERALLFSGRIQDERATRVRRALEPRHPSLESEQRLARRAAPASIDVLVVGVDFSDSLMVGRDRSQFPGWPPARRQAQRLPLTGEPQFLAHDATYFDLQMRRVADYFATVSFGRFELRSEVHPEILNLARPMGYYADPDSGDVRLVRMAREVVARVDADVDFSRFDTLLLVHAGAGRETDVNGDSPEQIYSNYLDARDFEAAVRAGVLEAPELPTAEGPIRHVLVLPESETQDPLPSNPFSGFFDVRGVYCFEIGLRLGMLSLADFTPSRFPDSQGIGNYGLMGYGLFTGLGIVPAAPCAMNRWLMGWVDAVEVDADADLRVGAMDAVGVAVSDTLLVRVPISDREYWLVEYRLQDPDGDLFYSFDDLNGNFVPDFFDADSALGDGRPTSPYDPAVDTWERELGAEWDYFMSENPARSSDGCERAGGSGLYIWHVDERVILDALRAGTNTINADPRRKGVDVEEADGIEDLDSAAGSPYLLGGDDDVWRGEGAARFGPDTRPSTATSEGVPTGIRFDSISTVVADSLPRVDGSCTGFVYRRAMTFSLRFGTSGGAGGPVEARRLRFRSSAPGAELRLVDLGTSAADPTPDGVLEIVALGDSGAVYVLDGQLRSWLDDGDPTTGPGILARLADAGGKPLSVAVADLDGDGRPELGAASATAVSAFDVADASGLASAFPGGEVVGGLIAHGDELIFLEGDGAALSLRSLRAGGGGRRVDGIAGRAVSAPAIAVAEGPTVAFVSIEDGAARLVARSFTDDAVRSVPLDHGSSGAAPVVLADRALVAVVDSSGHSQLVDLAASRVVSRSLDGGLPASALAAGPDRVERGRWLLAQANAGVLHAYDANLRERVGFPYAPRRTGESYRASSTAVAPILVDLDGDGRVEIVWHDPTGQLHAVDLDGRAMPGWPVSGPSEPVSAPAVGDVDGDGRLELVALGRFERLETVDGAGREYRTVARADLRVYDLPTAVGAFAPWGQSRGTASGAGRAMEPAPAAVAGGLREGSFFLHPNPADGDRVRVRVEVGGDAEVSVSLHDLQGERVVGPIVRSTPAGTAFSEDLDVSRLVPGMYVCRVSAAGSTFTAVLAVVR